MLNNFPPRIVNWISSDEGLFADCVEVESDEKQDFRLLMDLTNEYSLDQIVDKPTRERATDNKGGRGKRKESHSRNQS